MPAGTDEASGSFETAGVTQPARRIAERRAATRIIAL